MKLYLREYDCAAGRRCAWRGLAGAWRGLAAPGGWAWRGLAVLDGGLVGPGGARWWLGAGAANWCDENNVDAGEKKVFMSPSLKEQDKIRSLG